MDKEGKLDEGKYFYTTHVFRKKQKKIHNKLEFLSRKIFS
jgi:hypothetical protein